MPEKSANPRWWGALELPPAGASLLVQLGPFWIAATAADDVCRLVWSTGADPFAKHLAVSALEAGLPLPEGESDELRVPLRGTARQVVVTPRLAPRPYVCRPVGGVVLPPGGAIDAYVSTPLWLDIGVPDAALEVPTQRPNETWFGPDSIVGELCYSGRTALRTELGTLTRPPHRAITPVRVVNRSRAPLIIRRLRLPTPSLPLFADAEGGCWTPQVRLTVEPGSADARQEFEDKPPPEAHAAIRLSSARQPAAGGLVSRAVGALLP